MEFAGIGCASEILFVRFMRVAIIVMGASTGESHR